MTRAPFLVAGAVGSPYTRKLKALLIYRRLPCRFLNAPLPGRRPRPELPDPPLPLLPCLYLPESDGSYRAGSDTTVLIRELERLHTGRSVVPTDPVLALLSSLIEDYADEWLTKAMFHYRWGVPENVEHASKVLPLWNLGVSDAQVEQFRSTFAQRQIDRLEGVVTGSVEVTGPPIEAAYERLLGLLRDRLARRHFLLGARPCAGDFALYGQLTQLVQVEPTSTALARRVAPRVMAWVDVMEDLSGLDVDADAGWVSREEAAEGLAPLLGEIGRTYAPFMLANAAALEAGEERLRFRLDGRPYEQKPFAYQRKCLGWLRDEHRALAAADRDFVAGLLEGTGCEDLFAGPG